jgi:hypothetical protein
MCRACAGHGGEGGETQEKRVGLTRTAWAGQVTGLKACYAIPLTRQGHVVSVVVFYSRLSLFFALMLCVCVHGACFLFAWRACAPVWVWLAAPRGCWPQAAADARDEWRV